MFGDVEDLISLDKEMDCLQEKESEEMEDMDEMGVIEDTMNNYYSCETSQYTETSVSFRL
jgi:hypothetical protein